MPISSLAVLPGLQSETSDGKPVSYTHLDVYKRQGHIRERVDRLTRAAQGSTDIVKDTLQIVRDVNPIMATIGRASQEQAGSTAELSRNAQEAALFVEGVARRADEIDRIAHETVAESERARRATQKGSRLVGNMVRLFKPCLLDTSRCV